MMKFKRLCSLFLVFLFMFHMQLVNVLADDITSDEFNQENSEPIDETTINKEDISLDINEVESLEESIEEGIEEGVDEGIDEIKEETNISDSSEDIIQEEEIKNNSEDSSGNLPIINSVDINNNLIKAGDSLEIYADIIEGTSGINTVEIGFYIGETWSMECFYYDQDTGKYKYIIQTTEQDKYKKILISYIKVYDYYGNEVYKTSEEINNNSIYISDESGTIDEEQPIFNGIKANSTSIKAGETVDIYIDVNDSLSGVGRVEASYFIADEWRSAEISYDESSANYKFQIKTTEDMKYKTITMSYIDIYDNAGNTLRVDSYSISEFRVCITDENGDFDDIAPSVESIEFNKKELRVGDNLELYIGASDNLSGVKSVKALIFIGYDNYDKELVYDESISKYKCSIDITEDMIYKNVKLNSIYTCDNLGNSKYIYENLSQYVIPIVDDNGLVDNEAPVISNILINKDKVKPGEKVEVSLEAKDNLSGIKSIDFSYFINYSPVQKELTYDKETNKYKCTIDITDDMVYKRMTRLSINAIDNAENVINIPYVELDINKISILDSDGEFDQTNPSLNSISFSKEIAKAGDEITIFIDASDDKSGIKSVTANILVGDSQIYSNFEYDNNTNKYISKFTIPEDMNYGICKIYSVSISDNANNGYSKQYEDSPCMILVSDENGILDKESPKLVSTKVNTNTAKSGDVIKFEIDTSDEISGIKDVQLKYTVLGISNSKVLTYNKTSKKYEMIMTISEDMEYSSIIPTSLQIRDNALNITIIKADELKELIVNVPGENGEIDVSKPVIKSINIDKNKIKPGEEATISFDISDDLSGIKEAQVVLTAGGYSASYLYRTNLEYNESNKKYECKLIVKDYYIYEKIYISNIYVWDNVGNSLGVKYSDEYCICITDNDGNTDNEKPILNSASISKTAIDKGDAPIIRLNVKDDLSRISKVLIKYIDTQTSEEFIKLDYLTNYDNTIVGKNYDICIEVDRHCRARNGMYEVTEIIIFDKAGNESSYTEKNFDLSKLNFQVGDVLEEQKVTISTKYVYQNSNFITGKTSIGNVGLRLYAYYEDYLNNYYEGNLVIIDETIADENGNFELKNNSLYLMTDKCFIEVYDLNTNEVLGYKTLEVISNVDINKDGSVDILDISRVAFFYNREIDYIQVDYELLECDINLDFYIDLYDLIIISNYAD